LGRSLAATEISLNNDGWQGKNQPTTPFKGITILKNVVVGFGYTRYHSRYRFQQVVRLLTILR